LEVQVDILLDGELIGRGILNASDPPMGVAGGPFQPEPRYQPKLHAGEIDGVHNVRGLDLPFRVQAGDGGMVACQGVFIQDYSDSLGERSVAVLGIPYPEYEERFGTYPTYKAYIDRS
jgi:hypothetical protein